jgi:hypothetical protein
MFLKLWAKHVSEQIALNVSKNCVALIRQSSLQPIALSVAHEVCLDANDGREVVNESATASEDIEASDLTDVGMDVYERKSYRDFYLRIILRDQGHRC